MPDFKMKPGSKQKNTPGNFRQEQVDKVSEAYKKQGINPSSFSNFNKEKDTIIQGKSKMHSVARQIAGSNAAMGGYASVKEEKTFKDSQGNYSVQRVYSKK